MPGKKYNQIFWIVFLFLMIVYSAMYNIYPFSEQVNDLIMNVLYMVAVVIPAIVASAIVINYQKEESPHRLWLYVAVGFWVWTFAELIWILYNEIIGDVPLLSLADPFYLAGYFLLILAIIVQYKLINRSAAMSLPVAATLMWLILLVVTAVVFAFATFLANTKTQFLNYFGIYLSYLYSNADIGILIMAMLIIRAFRNGALGKPWWGFFILAAADYFYTWLVQTDAYAYQTTSGDILRFASDLGYMLAYLLIAYGFLQHYLLLRFGPPEIEIRLKP